jgi:lysophospholipase L1-like esterase
VQSRTAAQSVADDCRSLVFLTIGDSMTWGLGADHDTESYPARLPEQFERHLRVMPVQAVNIGVPGTSTSEGIHMLERFLDEHPDSRFDYALIMYGINNRWNLHDASFWEWDEAAKSEHYADYLASRLQVDKVLQIARQREAEDVDLRDLNGGDFRMALDDNGWDMFFDSFQDERLATWIAKDLAEIARITKERGMVPIMMTYHYERFGHLNDLIRRTARDNNIALLDIEKDSGYWALRMLYDKDWFHLNAKGYDHLAGIVADRFMEVVGRDAVWERWNEKQDECGAPATKLVPKAAQ